MILPLNWAALVRPGFELTRGSGPFTLLYARGQETKRPEGPATRAMFREKIDILAALKGEDCGCLRGFGGFVG